MMHAMLQCCQASTSTQPRGQRDAARLRSSTGGPAGAFLTAIPGGHMTLGNDMVIVSVCLCLGHYVPADVGPPRRANAVQALLPK